MFFCFVVHPGYAQNKEIPEFEFGKVDKSEFEINSFNGIAEPVIVLFDEKVCNTVDESMKRHCRIKVVTEEGVTAGNVTIRISKSEKLDSFKAICYNLENGEIVKKEISTLDILTEEDGKYRQNKKIQFPVLKLVLLSNTSI